MCYDFEKKKESIFQCKNIKFRELETNLLKKCVAWIILSKAPDLKNHLMLGLRNLLSCFTEKDVKTLNFGKF